MGLRLSWIILVVLPCLTALAEEKPVSVNFKAIQACDPSLALSELRLNVQLNALQKIIDQKYTTLSQRLLEREIYLHSGDQVEKRIKIVGFENIKTKQWETLLSVYRVNKSGEFELLSTQPKSRKNPKPQDLKSLFLNHQVTKDRVNMEDSKVNSVRMAWSRFNSEVLELKLTGLKGNKTLTCEKMSDGLVICTCTES